LPELPLWFTTKAFSPSLLPPNVGKITIDDNELKNIYNSHVVLTEEKAIKLCKLTLTQSHSQIWRSERKLRVTGSKAHRIYRARADHKRVEYFMNMKSLDGIEAVEYGLQMEPVAFQKYVEVSGNNVIQTGLVVKNGVWWLAASPDGMMKEDNGDLKVLEIKCPFSNAKKAIDVPYLNKDGMLKKSHQYYTQIQMQMYCCNAKKADLFIFSSEDYKIVPIPFDQEFC
jgi:putative phage-type endonuclease